MSKQERPVADITEVQLDHRFERQIAPALHLPKTSEAWRHARALLRPRGELSALTVGIQIAGRQRPWPDQAHISPQHIKELRQFVQTVAAQYPSQRRYTRIMLHFEDMTVLLVQGRH